jgi:peptide deformylase
VIQTLRVVLKSYDIHSISANQIGLNKSICIINIINELILINPEIIEHSDETFFIHEGCLSYPNTFVKTLRYKRIIVKSDNNDLLEFSYRQFDEQNNLELALVQHEIDHLHGIAMFDRKK